MVVAFAVGAAVANAIASFLQRLGVESAPRDTSMTRGLIVYMLHRPIWLLGFGCMGFGFAFQALALHGGALAVVQPLLTTEMLFVVIILWAWYGFSVRGRDWLFAALTIGGLAAFLVELSPSNPVHPPTTRTWVAATAATMVGALVLVVVARRGPPWWRALVLGAAASIGFAMTAAFTKAFSDAFGQGVGHVFATWETYAMCVVGLISFLLMQNAFHAGPFAASQSTLILINPLVSVGLGAWLYGESFPHGTGVVAIGIVATLAFVAGAVGLCTSPLIAGVHGTDDVQLLRGRGRLARWRVANGR